jgi:hypothetical protein
MCQSRPGELQLRAVQVRQRQSSKKTCFTAALPRLSWLRRHHWILSPAGAQRRVSKPGRMRFASITTNTIAECESALRRYKAWPFPAAHKTSGIAQTGSSAGAVQRRLVYPSRVCAPAYRSKRHRDERRPGRPRLLQFQVWGGSETLLPPSCAAQFLPKGHFARDQDCGHMRSHDVCASAHSVQWPDFFSHVESPRDGLRCPRRWRG